MGPAAFSVLLGHAVLVYLRKKKRTIKTTKAVENSLVAFANKDLQNATKNFSENWLGEVLVLFSKGCCLVQVS